MDGHRLMTFELTENERRAVRKSLKHAIDLRKRWLKGTKASPLISKRRRTKVGKEQALLERAYDQLAVSTERKISNE